MLEAMRIAAERVGQYVGESWQYVLFIVAILYLIIARTEKEHKKLFVGYTILFGIIYLCPVSAAVIMKFFIGESVYWRMLWVLPIPLILAYVCTRIWQRQKHRGMQFVCMIAFAALIMVSGKFVYGTDSPYVKAGNLYKLPPEVCWVCDIIRENEPESGIVGVVAPEELVGYIRQYDAGINLAYGRRDSAGKRRKWLREEMLAEQPRFKGIAKRARRLNCNFLIYPADEWQDETIINLGYEVVGQVNTYIIYRDTTM